MHYRFTQGLFAHQVGRLWRFKLSEVDDWIRAGAAKDDNKESTR